MNFRTYVIVSATVIVALAVLLLASYSGKGWLTFETAAHMATVAGTIIAVITFVSIAIQINQQTKLARAANAQTILNTSSDFVLAVVANKELARFWQNRDVDYDKLEPPQKAQFRYLVLWWFDFYENILYQFDEGLLDESVHAVWLNDMSAFVKKRRLKSVWNDVKGSLSKRLVTHFQPLIDDKEPPQ